MKEIVEKAFKLFIGNNTKYNVDFRTLKVIYSNFNDQWYNFIIPLVSSEKDIDSLELNLAVDFFKDKNFCLYVNEKDSQNFTNLIKDLKLEKFGDDNYVIYNAKQKLNLNVGNGFTISNQYDIKEVITLLEICFEGWENERHYSNYYEKLKSDGQLNKIYETFCIYHNDKVVATGSITLDTNLNLAYLHNTGTHPDFRGRGLHTFLITERINFALSNGVNKVLTLTERDSTSYKNMMHLGFRNSATYEMFSKS